MADLTIQFGGDEGTLGSTEKEIFDGEENNSGLKLGKDIVDISATTFKVGGTAMTADAGELNFLAGVTAGTATASKALVLGASKEIATITTATITTLTAPNIAGAVTFADGTTDVDLASHDGTNGLKLGGTLVTASAAEINAVADVSANAAIAANGDTLVVTAALHAGKVIAFGKTDGTEVTLPAATGTGNVYTFVISIAATSSTNTIQVANGTDVFDGSLNIQADDDADGTSKTWMAEVGDDTMDFAGLATTGGIVGGRITVIDYAAGFFSCTAYTISSGGAEVTPFRANVS